VKLSRRGAYYPWIVRVHRALELKLRSARQGVFAVAATERMHRCQELRVWITLVRACTFMTMSLAQGP